MNRSVILFSMVEFLCIETNMFQNYDVFNYMYIVYFDFGHIIVKKDVFTGLQSIPGMTFSRVACWVQYREALDIQKYIIADNMLLSSSLHVMYLAWLIQITRYAGLVYRWGMRETSY